MSRSWGAEHFSAGSYSPSQTSLYEAVKKLSPKAKQAMYAAGSKGLIKRMTWQGCAFNAAGTEVGDNGISSVAHAANQFKMSIDDVHKFITTWDNLVGDDADCTMLLMNTLNKVGLFSEPHEVANETLDTPVEKRTVSQVLYKSKETKLLETFQAQLESDTIPFMDEALELLCAG